MKSEPITEIDASAEESLSSKKGKDNLDVGRSPKDSLDLVTRKTSEIRRRPYGIVLGDLVGIDESGVPLVNFPGNGTDEYLTARSLVNLKKDKVGRKLVLMFEEGDPRKPVVMGLVRVPGKRNPANPIDVEIDGERVLLRAKKEIILRCGKASITLTRAGKVLIRGTYLLNRSSGVNRIKGGSVQIN